MILSLMKIGAVKFVLCLVGVNEIFFAQSAFFLLWVKLGIKGMHIMLWSGSDFRENRHREGLVAVNKVTFTRVP